MALASLLVSLLACAAGPRVRADVLADALAADALAPDALAADALDARPDRYVVVDVRSDGEWAGSAGHIPGALHLAYPGVKERGAEIPVRPGQTVVLVCLTGHRSQWAMDEVGAAVDAPVVDLRGGMVAWWGRGLPVEVEGD